MSKLIAGLLASLVAASAFAVSPGPGGPYPKSDEPTTSTPTPTSSSSSTVGKKADKADKKADSGNHSRGLSVSK